MNEPTKSTGFVCLLCGGELIESEAMAIGERTYMVAHQDCTETPQDRALVITANGCSALLKRAETAEERAESAERELQRAQEVVEAARCIRHWHDTMLNPKTGETEGMVVSAEHVRKLWEALANFDAAAGEDK